MLPQNHFLFGVLFSVALYFGFPEIGVFNLFIFLLASVLFDVDHYLYYVYKKNNWNLKNAIIWNFKNLDVLKGIALKKRAEFYNGFWFFHGFEVLALFGILGYFIWDGFCFVFFGVLFHLILDYVAQVRYRGSIGKVSIIYDYFKIRNLKFVGDI